MGTPKKVRQNDPRRKPRKTCRGDDTHQSVHLARTCQFSSRLLNSGEVEVVTSRIPSRPGLTSLRLAYPPRIEREHGRVVSNSGGQVSRDDAVVSSPHPT